MAVRVLALSTRFVPQRQLSAVRFASSGSRIRRWGLALDNFPPMTSSATSTATHPVLPPSSRLHKCAIQNTTAVVTAEDDGLDGDALLVGSLQRSHSACGDFPPLLPFTVVFEAASRASEYTESRAAICSIDYLDDALGVYDEESDDEEEEREDEDGSDFRFLPFGVHR